MDIVDTRIAEFYSATASRRNFAICGGTTKPEYARCSATAFVRSLSEGRDFDDFRGIFPPERLRGRFGQRPGPMRRDDFPSPIAPGDDRKGESPPDEIGPIPLDIQIGLIPAVAAMLRPESSPIHNCSRAQSLSSFPQAFDLL